MWLTHPGGDNSLICGLALRTAITLLLATVPWSVSAQTAQNENLKEVISNRRACVRTYAPAAQALELFLVAQADQTCSGHVGLDPLLEGVGVHTSAFKRFRQLFGRDTHSRAHIFT